MKTAVIGTGGKQYVVHENDTIIVDRMADKEGAKISFDEVFLTADGDAVTVGAPLVKDAGVKGEVVSHIRSKKVFGVKMKAKKRSAKLFGHKQHMTKVKITSIKA